MPRLVAFKCVLWTEKSLPDYARHNPENLPDDVMTLAGDVDAIVSGIMGPVQ